MRSRDWNPDKFRLRTLVNRLVDLREVDIHEEPVALTELGPIIEASTRAQLFRRAGPDEFELAASLSGTRRLLAIAFGVPEDKMREEFARRMANPRQSFEVPADAAPVQEVVLTGEQIDLTRLPFYVQHEYDGAPYISAGIDFTRDPLTGRNNVGARRLMLRGRDKAGINLTDPGSDLQGIYLGCVERGERLPCSFAIGVHPLYTMAAASRSGGNELDKLATYAGEPVAMVQCVTNDLRVPADAELVLEGYLDERGYVDPEGPYGEYMGFYGPMHGDPVFHVTAITRRRDVLHHSYKHGYGRHLGECDGGPMGMLQTEARAWEALKRGGVDVRAVLAIGAAGVSHHLRVALRKHHDGDARTAIALVLGSIMTVKHVFVTDDDVDIRSHDQMEWAMSTRFQADRDIVVLQNMKEMHMDPSCAVRGIGSKAGFDLTFRHPRSQAVTMRVPEAARMPESPKFRSVREALSSAPMHFAALVSALGSRDGREVVLEIEKLRDEGRLERNADGEYVLKDA